MLVAYCHWQAMARSA